MAAKKNITYRVSIADRFTKPLRKMQTQLESFKRTAERIDGMDITPRVDANTAMATKKLDKVEQEAKDIPRFIPITIVVNEFKRIKKEFDIFNNRVDSIADRIRNFSVVFQSAISGSIYAMIPAATTMLTVFGAGVANLGPIIGTTAGGLMGMASSLGAAAAGAGLLAPFVGTLGADLFKLDQNVGRNTETFRNFSEETKAALNALDSLQGRFGELTVELRDPIYAGMAQYFTAAETALSLATPAIKATADAFGRLGETLNSSLGSPDVRSFFDWLTTAAPRAFENWGEIIGNFTMGLLNLLRAFDPLAISMEQGFLRMSESFREWADSLSASQKFQDFIAYVQENGPKLLSIIGNIVGGLVGMFSAFAPLSADMLTSFEQMTQKFKEWGESLSQNEGFKNFINFVRENTPAVIEYIGRLTEFLIALGRGFADVGAFLLPLLNNLLQFSTWVMNTWPIVAKLAAIIPVLYGAFKMLAFPITLVTSAIRIVSPLLGALGRVLLSLAGNFTRLIPIVLRAGSFLLTFSNPVGIIISIVALLATVIIANWDKIWAWTKKTFGAAKTFLSAAWSFMKAKTIEAAVAIYTWAYRKFSEMKTAITDKMSQIKSQVQQKFQQAKDQARSIVTNMISAVKSKFTEMKTAVQNKMTEAKNKIVEIWNQAKEFLASIDLMEIGKDIIRGLISGITAMGGEVWEAAKGIAKKAKEAITGFMDSHSPSRVMMSVGNDVGDGFAIGIEAMQSPAERAATKLAEAASKPLERMRKKSFSFKGDGALGKYFNVMFGDDPDYMNDWITHLPKSMRGQVRNLGKQIAEAREKGTLNLGNSRSNGAQAEAGGSYTVEVPVYLNSREIARATAKDITKYQKLNEQTARGGR